jgi:general secretion pathway protein H
MVVIVIIGVLFSMAALSVSTSTDQSVEAEAKRFAALMKLASEEAIINTREMILEVDKRQYRFLVLSDQGFVHVEEGDKVFRPRELPDNLEIKLRLEDQSISFDGLEAENLPKIGIFSSGEMTPFSITFFRDDGLAYGVDADFFGKVEYQGKLHEGEFLKRLAIVKALPCLKSWWLWQC